MIIGVKNFRGERLREARLSRGLFRNALGDMIGVSGTSISNYEEGRDNPPYDRLEAIANKLSFPVEFFLKAGWGENISVIHWRSRASETKSAREMTEQRMRWLCEVFSFLDSDLEFPIFDLPAVDAPADFRILTGNEIERIARGVRLAWGFGLEPITDSILALENAGIPVTTFGFSADKQDGFCFRSETLNRGFVGINTESASGCRVRFDAAHELGHLVLHRHVTAEQVSDRSMSKIIEHQAHRFAGAFLFPKESFLHEVGAVTLDYLCALKRRWGVAISAMIMRAYDLRLIEQEHKSSLFRQMSNRKWLGREPYDDIATTPIEKPRMLKRGFEALIDSKVYRNSTIRSLLPHPTRELEMLAGLDSGKLSNDDDFKLDFKSRIGDSSIVDLENGNIIRFPNRYA